jgi:uncharacterized protein YidB (DUF937 family)
MVNLGGNLGKALGSLVGGALSGKDGNPLGSLLGNLGGDDEEKETNMLASVLELVQKSGGVTSVIEMFSSNGLGQKAQSWVGGGPNEALEPDQVQQVFGGSLIGKVASVLGVNSGQASSVVAKLLPEVVNQITPKGEVSGVQDDLISRGISLLGL